MSWNNKQYYKSCEISTQKNRLQISVKRFCFIILMADELWRMKTNFLIWHDLICIAAVPVSEWALRSVTGNVWWRRSHTVSEPSSPPANTMWRCVGWCVTQLAPIYKRTAGSKCGSLQVPSFKPLWYLLHTFLYIVRSIHLCQSLDFVNTRSFCGFKSTLNYSGSFVLAIVVSWALTPDKLTSSPCQVSKAHDTWRHFCVIHSSIHLGANIWGKVKTYGLTLVYFKSDIGSTEKEGQT